MHLILFWLTADMLPNAQNKISGKKSLILFFTLIICYRSYQVYCTCRAGFNANSVFCSSICPNCTQALNYQHIVLNYKVKSLILFNIMSNAFTSRFVQLKLLVTLYCTKKEKKSQHFPCKFLVCCKGIVIK